MDNRINSPIGGINIAQEMDAENHTSGTATRKRTFTGDRTSTGSALKKLHSLSDITKRKNKSIDPQLHWLTNNTHHTNVVLPAGRFEDARRQFQQILEASAQSVLYIHNPETLDDLKSSVEVDLGQLKLIDGPFKMLLASGGTLMLNVSSFSPQQLEAFNTLMEESKWEGQTLHQHIRILCLCDANTLKHNLLSGAQISRTAFQNMEDFPFETGDYIPVEEHLESYPEGTQLIDLKNDPMWSRTLLGEPSMNANQQWEKTAGAFSKADHLYVIRNAPDDPYLMDELLKRKTNHWNIRLERDLPERDIEKLIENKNQALNIRKIIQQVNPPLCIINASNFEEVLAPHYGIIQDDSNNPNNHLFYGKLTKHPSLLEQTQLQHETRVSLLVTDNLPEHLWNRMMQHPAAFNIATVSGIEIPKRYTAKIAQIHALDDDEISITDFENQNNIDDLFSQSVSFIHSADPTLFVRNHLNEPSSQSTTLLHVTPSMRSDALLYTLERIDKPSVEGHDRSTVPSLRINTHQLVNDLKRGQKIILQGLENNPQITTELATLLHPPHYLYINGERFHFDKEGGLTGRIVILTDSTTLLSQHALSARYHDPITGSMWKKQACIALHQEFPHLPLRDIQGRVNRILTLCEIVSEKGLTPSQTPPIHYAKLAMLFRQFQAADKVIHHRNGFGQEGLLSDEFFLQLVGSDFLEQNLSYLLPNGPDPELRRKMRAVLKDMLIGDYRQTGVAIDNQYDYLKICLRVLFPEHMNLMPDNSFDLHRLQDLLNRVSHPKDIELLGWRFLNTFSLDVIHMIIDRNLSTTADKRREETICKKVVALTLDQAKKQGLRLHPILEYAGWNSTEISPISVKLASYQRSPSVPQHQHNQDKAELVLEQGNAIFLKGPPGVGKTYQIKQLTSGSSYTINIADEGTQEFNHILAAWATSTRPATLIIDEANLALPENLAMLKSVFANRTLYVNGTVHRLSDQHRILFTGNADSLPGRSVQQVAQDSIPTLQFKTLKTDQLRKIFIDPVLHSAFGSHNTQLKEYCASSLLSIHTHLQVAFPEREFSPRDLEEFVAQTICLIREKVETPSKILEALPVWLAVLALNVYASDVAPEDKQVISTWLQHSLLLDEDTVFPELPHEVDLSKTGIADTQSTRELANKISWWLITQKNRHAFNPKNTTLGQQALLIEGPASRGKDTVVAAVLQSQGRPFVHINANPNNLDYLRQVLKDAYQSGTVVLISELNLLPSGILEGELNALLTGHVNATVQPGFALIATVNPSDYAGRNTLSSALKNRMQKITIQDYLRIELAQIAYCIAAELSNKKLAGKIDARIPDMKVAELVELHHSLLTQLKNQPSEFRPGIRQLRKALEQMQIQSQTEVKTIFHIIYAYYQAEAKTLSAGANAQVIPPMEAQQTSNKVRQLERSVRLVQPDWILHPKISPELGSNPPKLSSDGKPFSLRYDYDEHTIYFDENTDAAILCKSLMRNIQQGLLPPITQRSSPTDNASSNNNLRMIKPSVGKSGVGQPKPEGNLGLISGSRDRTYLPTARVNLFGQMRKIFSNEITFENLHQRNGPVVTLTDVDTETGMQGFRKAYLLVEDGTQPTFIQIDDQYPSRVYRDQFGAWFCKVNSNQSVIKTLRYHLNASPETLQSHKTNASFSGLDINKNKDLRNAILSIRQNNEGTSDVVKRLNHFFKHSFVYSDEDAKALNATNTLTERCQRFLEKGKGFCYEFSSTFAAILEQEFHIPAQLCSGHVTNKDAIPIEGHSWVEYFDASGRWHKVDPTAASSSEYTNYRKNKIFPYEVNSTTPHLDFMFVVPEKFSINELGLCSWEVKRSAVSYNAIRGELDLKRLLRGDVAIYRDANLSSSRREKSIYITDFPQHDNEKSWLIFKNSVMTPLAALIQSDIAIYALCRNLSGVKKWEVVEDLDAMFDNAMRADEANLYGIDTTTNVVLKADSHHFWTHLTSHYYETLFQVNKINCNDDKEVAHCIFNAIVNEKHIDSFPLQVKAFNKEWLLTLDDFEHYLIQHVKQNAKNDQESIICSLNYFCRYWNEQSNTIFVDEVTRLVERHGHQISLSELRKLIPVMFGEDRMILDSSEFRSMSIPILMNLLNRWLSALENQNEFFTSNIVMDLLSRLMLIWEEIGFNHKDIEAQTAMRIVERSQPDSLELAPGTQFQDLISISNHTKTEPAFYNSFKNKLYAAMTPKSKSTFNYELNSHLAEQVDQEWANV